MTSKFKQVKEALQLAWKIITLHYVYEYLLSRTIQFVVLSPIIIPLTLALAVLIIYVSLGIAFVACGLVVLGIISISRPLSSIIFIVSVCYIIYRIIFTAVSYVNSKWRILYDKLREAAIFTIRQAILAIHIMKDMLSDEQEHLSNYVVNKYGELYEKIHETINEYRFDVYHPVRCIVGYILDIVIYTCESFKNLRSKIGKLPLRLLWKPSNDQVFGQSDKAIPREELIQIVADDGKPENLKERKNQPGVTRRRFILPRPTQEDFKEIARQTQQIREIYKAIILQIY